MLFSNSNDHNMMKLNIIKHTKLQLLKIQEKTENMHVHAAHITSQETGRQCQLFLTVKFQESK